MTEYRVALLHFFVPFLCHSGKTEYQATHAGRLRRASTFERRPSKRYPSRTQSLGKGEPDVEGSQDIYDPSMYFGCDITIAGFLYRLTGKTQKENEKALNYSSTGINLIEKKKFEEF